MESVTLGEVAGWISLLAGVTTSLGVLVKLAGKSLHRALHSELEPIQKKLDELGFRQDEAARERAKNFIMPFLVKVEHGEDIDPDELKCFWDNYDMYKALGGNSYVHGKVEKLKAQGKL